MAHTTSSIMAQIQSLIAPPKSMESSSSKKYPTSFSLNNGNLSSKFNKKGNHETCDVCNEIGERLLCCNRCPAAFHLLCYNPPVEIEKLPLGEWVCTRCQPHERKKSMNGSRKSQDTRPQDCESFPDDISVHSFRSREDGEMFHDADLELRDELSQMSSESETTNRSVSDTNTIIRNGFDMIFQSHKSLILTPKKFEIPSKYFPDCPFLDPRKEIIVSNGHSNQQKLNKISSYNITDVDKDSESLQSSERNCVEESATTSASNNNNNQLATSNNNNNTNGSLSMVVCFKCDKGCRTEPLLRCDFCPLAFHTNCLEPPLTVLPDYYTPWMCPIHPHHALEKKYPEHASSLTKRISLWKKYEDEPLDKEQIKIDFLKKIYDSHVPIRKYQVVPDYPSVRVPLAIKSAYQNRPSRRDTLPEESASFSLPHSSSTTSQRQFDQLDGEQKDFLKSMFFFAGSIAKRLTDDGEHNSESTTQNNIPNQDCQTYQDPQIAKLEEAIQLKEEPMDINENDDGANLICHERLDQESQSDLSVEPEQEQQSECPFRILEHHDNPFDFLKISSSERDFDPTGESVETLTCPPSEEGFSNDTQRIVEEEPVRTKKTQLKKVGGTIDILDQIDLNLVRLLAYQRLQQLNKTSASLTKYDVSIEEKLRRTLQGFHYDSPVQCRATLCPLVVYPEQKRNFCCQPKSMMYRSFSFGTDRECDLVLSDYGFCNRISPRHATIYFDEVEQVYELLNYSEHGTVVDDVHYCCDFSDKPAHSRTRFNQFTSETITGIEDILLESNRLSIDKLSRANRKFLRKEFVYDDDNYTVNKRAIHDVQEINAQMSAMSGDKNQSPVKKIQFPKMKLVNKSLATDKLKECTKRTGRARSRDEKPDSDNSDNEDDEIVKRMRRDSENSLPETDTTTAQPKEVDTTYVEDELLRKWRTLANPPNVKMSATSGKKWSPCRCDNYFRSNVVDSHGWEGAALLKHGSLIKFGCLEFVFCISNFSNSSN